MDSNKKGTNAAQRRKRRRNRNKNNVDINSNNNNNKNNTNNIKPDKQLTKSQQRRLRRKNTNTNDTKQPKAKNEKMSKKSSSNRFGQLTAEEYGKKFMKWNSKYLHDVVLSGYIRPIIARIKPSNKFDIRQQLIVFGYTRSVISNKMNIPKEVIAVIINYHNTSIDIPVNIHNVCSLYLHSFVKWERWTHLGLGDFLEDVCEYKMASTSTHPHYKVEWIHINLSAAFYRFREIEKRIFVRKLVEEKWPFPNIGCFDVTLNGLADDGYTDHDKYTMTLFKDNIEHLEYILYKKWKAIRIVSLSNMNLNDNDIVYLCNVLENIYNFKSTKTKMKGLKGLEIIDLSSNNFTDKYIALLLRTIKKYIPTLKELILAFNKITNKSISTIMKYDIYGLQMNLTGCSGVTFKALNKYQRGDYNDGNWIRYLFCKNSIYFGNKREPQSAIKTKMGQMGYSIIYHPSWH